MFCSNCGNRLNDGEAFCPRCGARAGAAAGGGNPYNNVRPDAHTYTAAEIKDNFIDGIKYLYSYKMLYLVNMGLIILSLVFCFTKSFSAKSYFDISEKVSLAASVEPIFLLLYGAALGVMIIPLLLRKPWQRKYFLPAKIVLILSALYFILVFALMYSESNSDKYSGMVQFGLTLSGWLYVGTTAGALFLTFKNSAELRN